MYYKVLNPCIKRGPAHLETPPVVRMSGFTLAETLITLVIIGVIAAMTVPTLIMRNQEQQNVVAVKKFYSEMSQAYHMAMARSGPPQSWEWGTGSDATAVINTNLKPHLRIMTFCDSGGTNNKCFGNATYKTLQNTNWEFVNPAVNQGLSPIRLDNGFLVWFSVASSDCSAVKGTSPSLQKVCGSIGVDINGYKKPNSFGRDTFYFYATRNGIVPYGTKFEDSNGKPFSSYCQKSGTSTMNGYSCSAWVIENGNMDYLHQNVNW